MCDSSYELSWIGKSVQRESRLVRTGAGLGGGWRKCGVTANSLGVSFRSDTILKIWNILMKCALLTISKLMCYLKTESVGHYQLFQSYPGYL